MRKSILRAGSALMAAAAIVAVTIAARPDEPARVTLAASTSASPTDGAAYVKEAIDNLRGAERFRFAQTIDRGSGPSDPGDGTIDGAVDLSSGAGDDPKLHTKLELKRTNDGQTVVAEQKVIGEDVQVKNPGRSGFTPSDKKPHKARGKKQGRTEEVDVIDPVMLLLEPVDTLPADAFGTPSPVDAAGNRTVAVAAPGGGTITVTINDTNRLVVALEFERNGERAILSLRDVGSPDIVVG